MKYLKEMIAYRYRRRKMNFSWRNKKGYLILIHQAIKKIIRVKEKDRAIVRGLLRKKRAT
jgi:hypothetical protein